MNRELMFSSGSDCCDTPQDFFDKLNEEFKFTLDACALPENTKCERFFTPEQDGLQQEWTGTVWCNPPYGRTARKWVQKGSVSARGGQQLLCCCPPARTPAGFTILSTTKRKSDLFEAA